MFCCINNQLLAYVPRKRKFAFGLELVCCWLMQIIDNELAIVLFVQAVLSLFFSLVKSVSFGLWVRLESTILCSIYMIDALEEVFVLSSH